jgi:hypothetical protein
MRISLLVLAIKYSFYVVLSILKPVAGAPVNNHSVPRIVHGELPTSQT